MKSVLSFYRWSIALGVVGAIFVSSANAAVVYFSENFESINTTGGPVSLVGGGSANSAFTTVNGATDAGNVIQAAPDLGPTPLFTNSNYLRFVDGRTTNPNSNPNIFASLSNGPVTGALQLTFDFYDPVPVSAPLDTSGVRVILADNMAFGNLDNSVVLILNNGLVTASGGNNVNGDGSIPPGTDIISSKTYTTDASHKIGVAVNYGNALINYGNGYSLGPRQYDVWIDGELFIDEADFRGDSGVVSATHFRLQGNSGGSLSSANFDNLLVTDTITVPEPSAFMMISIIISGQLLFRKRGGK